MSRFWIIICAVIALVFVGVSQLPPSRPRFEEPEFERKLLGFLLAGTLVAIVWAICFREQIEKRRFSLWTLFALGTMEAIMLGVARTLGSFHP